MNIHNARTQRRLLLSGLAVVAVAGVTTSALLVQGNNAPVAAAAHHQSTPMMVQNAQLARTQAKSRLGSDSRTGSSLWRLTKTDRPTASRDTASGGSELGRPHINVGEDKATQVHMVITNNTSETLNLTSAVDSGSGSHWQNRATDLAPNATETVSNYASGDAEITLTYTGATTGTVFKLNAETPLVGSNTVSGSSYSTSYTVNASAGSGYNPTDTFSIQPGQTFNYSGQSASYVVPPGVTQLAVTAVGGAGGNAYYSTWPSGAEVNGTMAVTPGEVLTLGVGGYGDCTDTHVTGGWGLTTNGSDFSGGNGSVSSGGAADACPGGGATVIVDPSGSILVVAGGGGGDGAVQAGLNRGQRGGRGGYGGWTGESGVPFPGGGGQAGGNSSTQGQSTSGAGEGSGGAGGGGNNGGAAGISGGGAGGGAGASAAPGLTGATVSNIQQGGNVVPAYITFAPTS
jgi:hypothetical protein